MLPIDNPCNQQYLNLNFKVEKTNKRVNSGKGIRL
jgi:hypothetical protein